MRLSKKINPLSNKDANFKTSKYQNIKKNVINKKDKVKSNKVKLFKPNIKFNIDYKTNIIKYDISTLINDIQKNEKLLERIKYLQLWWKTIFQIIKIQKYLRGFLHRVKLSNLLKIKDKINIGIKHISKLFKVITYKTFIGLIKNNFKKRIINESSIKGEFNQKNNKMNCSLEFRKNINDNKDCLSFEKIFLTSRKTNKKQKAKIKNYEINKNRNNNFYLQHTLTKRMNINNPKVTQRNGNIKITKNIHNKNNSNPINKIEISHQTKNKTKKLIKYRNELNNLNKYKSYRQESLKKGDDTKNSSKKKNNELEYISTHQLRFDCKTLFNLNEDKQNQNNNHIIRVQKRAYKNNNIENEEANNLRRRSFEKRSNKKFKSFNYNLNTSKKKNKSGSKGKKEYDFDFTKTDSKYKYYNNCKKDMIMWLNSWEQKNIKNKNQTTNNNIAKGFILIIRKISSYNYSNNGTILFHNLKFIKNFDVIKRSFEHYKNIVSLKNILIQLKEVQKSKINERKRILKICALKKLILKLIFLKKYFIKWKILKYQYNKYNEEKIIKLSSSDIFNSQENIDDYSNDYFNKSQPEMGSLKINNYNFLKNKYNIPNIKSNQNRNNNINININYNLITNNNALEQGIYIKKKIDVPKCKRYHNNSCIIGEKDHDDIDNNIINEQKEFMNNSMITRRIKINKKENNQIYFPKHVKQGFIQNDSDYLIYKNRMQFTISNDKKKDKNGVIHKKINLKYKKIFDVENGFI